MRDLYNCLYNCSMAGLIATALFLPFFFASHFAHADPAVDRAEELVALLAPLNSLEGHFQQTLVDDKGELLQTSNGIFSLQRPGLFRWRTLAPFPQLLVSNQQTIWLYDEDLEQVIIRPYTEAINKTPALLLSGDPGQLSAHYRVTRGQDVQGQGVQKKSGDVFILINKSKEETLTEPFKQIVLSFENRQLSAMELTDTLGQISLFRFTDLKVNPLLAVDLFTFEPPPGIDVIVDD